eukprot:1311854-Pyramimonas_sp.AAC.2
MNGAHEPEPLPESHDQQYDPDMDEEVKDALTAAERIIRQCATLRRKNAEAARGGYGSGRDSIS